MPTLHKIRGFTPTDSAITLYTHKLWHRRYFLNREVPYWLQSSITGSAFRGLLLILQKNSMLTDTKIFRSRMGAFRCAYTRSRFYLIRAYAIFYLVVQTKLRVNKRARSYLYRCKKVKLRCKLSDTKKVSSYMISHIDKPFPKYTSIIQKYWYFSKVRFKREITNLDRPFRRSAVVLAAFHVLALRTVGLNW